MSIKVMSEDDWPDWELWTCDVCGYQVCLQGVGGDVAECPGCIKQEYEAEAEHDREQEAGQ